MYEISEYQDRQYKIFELKDNEHDSYVKLAPERGGIITGFGINGQEILYMDEDTFYDSTKYVRGGNPILFPICGTLNSGEYVYNGDKYKMENHGLVRNYPWQVVGTDVNDKASIKIKFKSSDITKKYYPFDFEMVYTYTLKGNVLTIDQEYINNSEVDMPVYAGFHPYFNITNKSKLKYEIDASLYFDFEGNDVKSYNGFIDMTDEDKSKIFLDVKSNHLSFYDEGFKRKISMEYSSEFKYIVLWSVIGKNFICIEPWMAKPDSMNTKEDLYFIKPHDSYKAYLTITY